MASEAKTQEQYPFLELNTGAKMLKLSNTHGKQEITCISIDTGGKRLLTGARNGNVKVC